jgi:nitroreductase/NAD-dependent dihydropyrimidine dehydrogenase PreA subunit
MVLVDEDRCVACGRCVDICHEQCIAVVDDVVRIDDGLCSTCTQCIAICPQKALSWNGAPSTAFDASRLPSPEQLDELFKQRRTIRFFKDAPLDPALVEEIVGYGIYAPTNHYDLRAVVVDDPDTIKALDQVVVQFTARMYNLFFRPQIVFNLLRKLTPALKLEDKVKMEEVAERGSTIPTPAALVFIVGDPWIAHAEASAQYAMYNIILYAQSRGLGSCIWGGGKLAFGRSRVARRLLGLKKRERVLGGLLLGYGAVTFRNKVAGKTLPIQWNGGKGSPAPRHQ